jgi:hypothetical protein
MAFAALLALTLASCSSDNTGGDTSSGTATESACEGAFAAAAAIGDMEDTVEDLDPAVRACETIDEWTAASEAHPGALDGADPVVYLTNRCLYGNDSVKQTLLCQSLG